MSQRVATLPVDRIDDVFALRQSGRAAAAAIGCEESEQVRAATALSELGREALLRKAGASVTFSLEEEGTLLVEIERFPVASLEADSSTGGFAAAQRLIGPIQILPSNGTATLKFHIRRNALRVPVQAVPHELRDVIRRTAAPHPLEALRLENRDLIVTLAELKAQQEQLMELNDELQETNRGVMTMYAQLAGELEETNRGVVALYAELDDKSARLHEASQAKSRFLASVSHELRSPVNSILGLAGLLLERAGGEITTEQEKQLNLIRATSSELLRLVNDLLDLAKAESGRLQPEIVELDLAAVLTELRASLRPFVRPEVALIFETDNAPRIETDRLLITQVVRNLVVNALKFTVQGSVRVSAAPVPNGLVEITVADTGIGIAPEDQSRIFEEFVQVRGPLQSRHKGSGLGLPYARRVTQTLGGNIRLESTPGQGSTFTVQIPMRREQVAGTPAPAPRPVLPGVLERILVIDDDEAFRARMRALLQGLAKEIHEASGGVEGLGEMRRARPDVAFLDLRMPDLGGAEVLGEMNADTMLRDIPVVIVTATELHADLRLEGTPRAMLSKLQIDRDTVERAIAQVTGA